jgi:hypothetical protein
MEEWQYGDWVVPRPLHYVSDPVYLGLFIGLTLCALFVFLYAFRLSRRLDSSYPIWVCVGALLAAFYEPVGDVLAHLSYMQTDIYFIHTLGNTIPVFLPPGYVIFFGWPILYLIGRIDKGIGLKQWMVSYSLIVLAAAIFELPFIAMDVHHYFGENQPVQILGYPIWMPFVNGTSMFLAAAVAYLATKHEVFERQPLWYALLIPFLVAGGGVFFSLPIGLVISSSANVLAVNLGAIGSVILSVLGMWLAGNMVCRRRRGTARESGFRKSGVGSDSL